MGCCTSQMPAHQANELPIDSTTQTTHHDHIHQTKSADLRRYSAKTEPKVSYDPSTDVTDVTDVTKDEKSNSKTKEETSFTPDDFDNDNNNNNTNPVTVNLPKCPSIITPSKSEWELKMEERKSELLREKQKLRALQQQAFELQVQTQQAQNFKRLYDIWKEFAHNSNNTRMDIDGLTKSLAVFGMIIDTDRDSQKHIFKKFDLDNEKEIAYADFSATIASFVGSNTDDDSLQTLFEIFDISNKGYLEIEDMARILLAQNQIAMVVTGTHHKQNIYTKKQCLKAARRMVAQYDSKEFNDNKISFNEFKAMMNSRTENDMMLHHMKNPSISHCESNEQNPIPIFVPTDNEMEIER